jgi:hypothetical protein
MKDVDMDRDQDVFLAPAGGQEALVAAGRQIGVWQVLSKVPVSSSSSGSSTRATSGMPSAAYCAAGYASSKRRLLIAEVSLYTDAAATSSTALEQANRLLAGMTLPGDC